MSETTSAPAPSSSGVTVSPTPATPQPATPGVSPGTLSIREAARVLGRRRHEANREGPGSAPDGAQAPAGPRPSPNDLVASTASPAAPEGAAAEPKPAPPAKVDALAAALGQPSPDAAPSQESTATYEIDGRTYSADDLKAALVSHNAFTQKTQTLAAQQKQVAEQAQQLRQLHEQHQAFATVLPLLQPELNRLASTFQMQPRPDPALLRSDPTSYLEQLAAHEQSRAELERLQQIMGVQTGAQERHLAQAVEKANQVLSEKYPVWRDPQQRAELQQQIVQWAETKGGYTREELKNLSDHRHLEALMKAAMYDRLSEGARTRAPTQMAPTPGAAPPPPLPAMLRERQAAFDAKPDWRTGAALISARRALGR